MSAAGAIMDANNEPLSESERCLLRLLRKGSPSFNLTITQVGSKWVLNLADQKRGVLVTMDDTFDAAFSSMLHAEGCEDLLDRGVQCAAAPARASDRRQSGPLTVDLLRAAQSIVEAHGGSLPSFYDEFILRLPAERGVNAAYWAPFAPRNGTLHDAMRQYLMAPKEGSPAGLNFTEEAADAAMTPMYSATSSFGEA